MGTVKRLMWFALSDECLKANVWVLSARADEGKEDTSFRTGPEHRLLSQDTSLEVQTYRGVSE
jgi:hypothetical protein